MAAEAALKQDLKGDKSGYDEGLHERFMLWKAQSGTSVNVIAKMINRSAALVSLYVNKKYSGDIKDVEKDIASLLRREQDLEFTVGQQVFCSTGPTKLIWEVLQYCDEQQDMGVAVGPAGIGKTQTCNAYKRKNRGTVFLTADIATRSVGAVLHLMAKKAGGTAKARTNSRLLHHIIDKLKNSRRLILIDEAHFLTWEAFEVVRKIHDCAGVGVAYIGMERLYDQMRGGDTRAMLYEQIYSRIAIKRDDLKVTKADVRMVAGALAPGLDKASIDFLYDKARGKGKLRTVAKLLKVGMKMHKEFGESMDLALLEQAAGFLMA